MRVAITVEGQRGLTWPRWQKLATAVEELGFYGLYRSDHFLDAHPPDQDSLELWTSLTWLASHTKTIEFGPLVTPLSFRHPVHTARMAKEVDELFSRGLIAGTPSQIVDQLGEFEAVGLQKVMLQWADLEDLDSLASFAQIVLTQIKSIEA